MGRKSIGLLHSAWRRLPQGLRRGAYEEITARLASPALWTERTPRLPGPPYVVAGPLTAPTGLGQAARLVIAALRQKGRDVSAIDLGPALMQRAVVPLPELPPARPGPGTLILMSVPPTIAHSVALIGRSRLRDKLRIGFWAWELDQLPPSWGPSARFMHALAAPSRFCADAITTAFGEPVRLTPYPVAAIPAPRRHPGEGDAVTFGAAMDLGSTAARKNPGMVVEAFRAAFSPTDPVKLILKLRDPGADPPGFARLQEELRRPGAPIELLLGDAGPDELEGWWRKIDVLVSLHRSEGFGLVPAEALQRGIPVISTDASATAEFVTAGNGWPVRARPVPARDDTGRYEIVGASWAEPDFGDAVAAMRDAASDRERLRAKGAQGAADIDSWFSAGRFVEALEAPISARERER